jgi:drug/metabolite transporter (DMT)-like permease
MTLQVLAAVLLAASIHAAWNTWLKVAGDRLVVMALMGGGWALFAICWLPFVAWPGPPAWTYLAASVVFHFGYSLMLVSAYGVIDLGVAYPMIRGSGPLFVTLVSVFALGESIGFFGVAAVMLVTIGVAALGLGGRSRNGRALAFGLIGGSLVATYTLLDGLGARVSGTPHGYAMWLFVLTGIPLVVVAAAARGRQFVALARPVAVRGLTAGALAGFAFWIVIWALTQAPMGLVAAGRETSVVFVALASGWMLKERVNWWAIGAVSFGVALLRLAGA